MRKSVLLSCICVIVLLIGVSAQARPKFEHGEYHYVGADGGFKTFFWQEHEMFTDGRAVEPGRRLMALGKGFVLKRAVLQREILESITNIGAKRYETTYTGGELILNSAGPWLQRGTLIDKDIEEIKNTYTVDGQTMEFKLTFCGEFDNAPGTHYKMEATYNGEPKVKLDRNGNMMFRRGFGYDATITISDKNPCQTPTITPVEPF
jgi:hypothetical protein